MADELFFERTNIERLSQAYINEKCAPVILPYEQELIEDMLLSIRLKETEIQDELQRDPRHMYYEAEVERVRWIVRAYLRTRLHKLNTHAIAVLDDPSLVSRLSPAELKYANGFAELVTAHATQTVTSQLQEPELKVQERAGLLPRPKAETLVFCRVDEDVDGEYDLGPGPDEGAVTLRRGNVLAARYSAIEPLLLTRSRGESNISLL